MMLFYLLVILVPISAMFVNSYFSSQLMIERKYTDLLFDITRQSNIRIEEFLDDTRRISLISSYGINSYSSAISQENYPVQNYLRESSKSNEDQAAQLLMNYITMKDRAFSIYVYNLNGGKDLFVSPNKPVDYTYSPREEKWFRDFLISEEITRDEPTRLDQQTKKDDNWTIHHLRKIFDMENGKLIGIMVISIDIEFVNNLNKSLQASSRSAYTIVDSGENVIFNSDYGRIGAPFREGFPLNSAVGQTVKDRQVVTAGDEDYILIRSPFAAHPWTAYMYMPIDELAVEENILKRNLWTLVIVLVFFAMISSLYLSNLITRPIKRLMKNMTLVEQGKFDNLPAVRSNDEIGLLAARFEQMSGELKQLVERIYQEQEEKAEAEIRALQAQINPHFLYNTLHSLKWIASMQRSDKIVEMTEALISILRYASKTENGIVPIREELENIRHYVTIQKVRYFNRISVRYSVDEALLDDSILKLSVQPIVENAIFHGIADLEEEGNIEIGVSALGGKDIEITVRDNGKGMDAETAERLRAQLYGAVRGEGGIGVRNVHDRIRRVFGEGYGVSFASEPGLGTTFTITIPRRRQGGDAA